MKKLASFNYKRIDNSLTSRHITRYVFALVQKRVSPSIHPNAITLFGFISALCGLILTYFLDPTLTNPPRLLIFANLVALILYFVADGIDGIHARATKRASPLGYILDHGIDSMVCTFVAVGLSSTMRLGLGRLFLLFLLSFYTNFYSGAILHRYTGFFIFNYISGCSEGILAGILLYAINMCYPLIYLTENGLFKIFSISIEAGYIEALFAFGILYCLANLAFNVHSFLKKSDHLSFLSSIYNIAIPLGIFFIVFLNHEITNTYWRWLLINILSCCFSLCYIEETLSVMLKSTPPSLTFICVDLILSVCFITVNYQCDKEFMLTAMALLSSSLLFIRAFSVVRSFCKRAGQKFLS